MTANLFQKATKKRAKLRLAIDGPSGSGKTYTALTAARALGGKVAVIDTERGSASLYSDKFEFDVAELNKFSPQAYIDLIEQAESAGYDVIVIDSLSHAWEGEGGALDMADAAKTRTQNQFTAWKDVTPLHRKLVDAMLQSKCHIIATMRSKTEYILEAVERNGRTTQVPRKVGMAPVQRQGMEYEFTVVCDMDTDHNISISKSRCSALADAVANRPGEKFFKVLVDWLNDGGEAPAPDPATTGQPPVPTAKPPKNGNGQMSIPEMTLEQAAKMKTPKGILFADLTDEQLQVVLEKATSPDGITAAGLLIRARAEMAEKIETGEVPF